MSQIQDPSILSYQTSRGADVVESANGPDSESKPELEGDDDDDSDFKPDEAIPVLRDPSQPKYDYSIEQLKGLAKSPLVKCPELQIDTSSFVSKRWKGKPQGYDDQQSRFKNSRYDRNNNNNSSNAANSSRRRNNKDFDHHHHHQNSSGYGRRAGNNFFELDAGEAGEPEWMENADDILNSESTGMDMGNTVEEFEAWKARKKIEDMRLAGIEVPENEKTESSASGIASPAATGAAPSVDRMFDMWASPAANSRSELSDFSSAAPVPLPPSNKASKFSRFFNSESPSGSPSIPSGTTVSDQQQQQQQQQQQRPHEKQSEHQSLSNESPGAASGSADKQGFQRIMQMLDKSNSGTPQPDANQNQQPAPSQPEQQPQQGNDLFFQSLLNKSDSKSSPQSSAQSPASEKNDVRRDHQQERSNSGKKSGAMRGGSGSAAGAAPAASPSQQQPPPPPHQHFENMPQNMPFPPPPPPPGMFENMPPPPPGMFENMPPPPPGMMFPPPPPHMQGSGFPPPPPPGFPPPFFGNFPVPPPPPPGSGSSGEQVNPQMMGMPPQVAYQQRHGSMESDNEKRSM